VGLGRKPFCLASGELLDYLENNKNNGFIAWHSIANFFYITAKGDNKQQSKQFILELCSFLHIVSVSNPDLMNALALPLNDFEDAMQCALQWPVMPMLLLAVTLRTTRIHPSEQ